MRFSSKNLAAFYYQLGTLLQAGLPIQNALHSIQKTAPRPMRRAVAELLAVVNQGSPLHEAMESCPRCFASLDVHTINMTERSGALDVGLLSLSHYYESLAAARRKLVAGLIYPVCLFVAGVFIPPLPYLVIGKITTANYLWITVGLFVRLALVVWVISFLLRWSLTVPRLNLIVDRLIKAVPVFGRLRFDYALSQWLSSVRLMLRAGIGIVDALKSASSMVHCPLIADAYDRAAPMIGGQLDVSQALASTGVFPDELIQLWATGEQSGKMDEMLDRLTRFYEERWRRNLDQVVTWLPRIIYLLFVFYMIWQVVHLFGLYMSTYNNILNN